MSNEIEKTVNFHGATLKLIDHEGEPYVAMKPIVEGMGLDWAGQHLKLQHENFEALLFRSTARDGKGCQMTCIPLYRLKEWLLSVNRRKVSSDSYPLVSLYQEECFEVLNDLWLEDSSASNGPSVNEIQVRFHDDSITLIDHNGEPYVAMKPIVENLGMDWKTQRRKIANNARWGHMTPPCKTAGGIQEMLCIPMKKLNGWLFSVNAEKVKPELRDKVLMYQEECFAVLYDYWVNGAAVNPEATISAEVLTKVVSEAIARATEEAERRITEYERMLNEKEQQRQKMIQEHINKALNIVSPKSEFGEISKTTGRPKTFLNRAYFSSRNAKKTNATLFMQLSLPFSFQSEGGTL